MGRVLRPPGLHHDAGRQARGAQGHRVLSRLRAAAAARRGLFARGARAAAAAAGRDRHAPPQPRARGPGARVPGAVPVELQPLQDAERRQAPRGKRAVSRLVFAFMWLLHFLPLRMIAAIGNAVGAVLYWLIPERRRVTRINLEKCFPQMPPRSRERLARAHFRAFCRSFIERGILWWAPRGRIERMVRIEGLEHLQAVAGGPVILLTPHFVGLEAPLFRISMDYPVASMYSRQKDPLFDRLMYLGRTRFGARLFPRQASVRESLRAIASGAIYYYLPDLDFGRRRSVFVPFLEERVLEMPEQYFWLHKRFKTRPEGEARFY